MKIFISGGCKNGKSSHAERIAVHLSKNAQPLYYAATMEPGDAEDDERIARHRKSRAGMGFATVEIPSGIVGLKTRCDMGGTILLDSVTALLANEMFTPGGVCADAHVRVADELLEVLEAAAHMIVVSDYIYSDAALYDSYTEAYRRSLAYIDRRCAAVCDVAMEICCGIPLIYKGRSALEAAYEAVS